MEEEADIENARKSDEIQKLLLLLEHEDPLVQAKVLQILIYKCKDPNTRLLIKNLDGISTVEMILHSGGPDEAEAALEALTKLWQLAPLHHPQHIGAVVDILKHGSPRGKYSAVIALTYFSQYPRWFVLSGAVPALFNLLKDTKFTEAHNNCRETIIHLLQAVTECEEGKSAVGTKMAELLLQPASPAEARDAAVIANQFKLSLRSSPLLTAL